MAHQEPVEELQHKALVPFAELLDLEDGPSAMVLFPGSAFTKRALDWTATGGTVEKNEATAAGDGPLERIAAWIGEFVYSRRGRLTRLDAEIRGIRVVFVLLLVLVPVLAFLLRFRGVQVGSVFYIALGVSTTILGITLALDLARARAKRESLDAAFRR